LIAPEENVPGRGIPGPCRDFCPHGTD
jgi:hypothetical protein